MGLGFAPDPCSPNVQSSTLHPMVFDGQSVQESSCWWEKTLTSPQLEDAMEAHTDSLPWVQPWRVRLIESLACPQMHLDRITWSVWDTSSQHRYSDTVNLWISTSWSQYVENPCHTEGTAQIPQLVTCCRFQFFSRWNWAGGILSWGKRYFFFHSFTKYTFNWFGF